MAMSLKMKGRVIILSLLIKWVFEPMAGKAITARENGKKGGRPKGWSPKPKTEPEVVEVKAG